LFFQRAAQRYDVEDFDVMGHVNHSSQSHWPSRAFLYG
jgi:acyl-CoA thioesterase FadM